MKRFVFLLLTAWLLSSGFAVADVNLRGYAKENGYQYLAFGRFPQTADGKEQPILWRILSATDKEAYLLSEYILFNNRVHPDDDAYRASGGAFNQTEIYALLNGPLSASSSPRRRRQNCVIKHTTGAHMTQKRAFMSRLLRRRKRR